MAEATADLECRGINKDFGTFRAVNDVSFAVPPGTFFSILGPSGCGKTTLLRMAAGFLEPTSGDLLIKGRSMLNVPPNKRPVSMVFQHLALFPMMDVAANIGFGLRRRGEPREDIARKVDAVLARVGLPDVGSRRIEQLSGGQKQRIAIARCMVLEPDVLLLDEPLGALDLKLREHMKVELKQLQSEFNTTFVYITHDQSEALVMSDQIAVMNHGVFEQVGGARELYYDPKTAFVAGFVGDSNRFSGTIESIRGGKLKARTPSGFAMTGTSAADGLSKGDSVDIFVRPEAVRLALSKPPVSKLANATAGTVDSILFNGANSRVLVRDEATKNEIDVAIPQTGEFAGLKRGDKVYIGWDADQTRCFAAVKS
ncbi:MAG: ABC transporter ATP-binding protein [Rhodobiaceae bacterium]|nr:ABC transporter ATP-binding protein [Rhodobiaceae bacterium]